MIPIILLFFLVSGYFFVIYSKSNRTHFLLLEKFFITIITSILFSLALALALYSYTPISKQFDNTDYTSFGELFFIYFLYSSPIFFIFGTTFSLIIEIYFAGNLVQNRFLRYVIHFSLYAASGFLTISFFEIVLLFSQNDLQAIPLFILGICGSLLFFHISFLAKFLKKAFLSTN